MIWWLATAWAGVCGMPEPASMQPLAMPPVVHRMDGNLLERDAFNPDFPHLRTSEHFALKWGEDALLDEDTAAHILDALEQSWTVFVDELGHVPPAASETYLLNVYAGNSGDGAPGIEPHQRGYYTTDPDGMPMIVVQPGLATRGEDAVQALMAHELYHVMQDASLRMDGQDVRWFWEATAVWSETVVFPDNLDHVRQAAGYVQRPHAPLASYTDLATDADRAQTQYGAYLLPLYLSDHHGVSVITDTWQQDLDADPIEALRESLARREIDFDTAFVDHAAATAMFDGPYGDAVRRATAGPWVTSDDARPVAARVSYVGTAGRVAAPTSLAPGRYGFNVLGLSPVMATPFTVTLFGDLQGSENRRAIWGARLAMRTPEGVIYTPFVFDEAGRASLTVDRTDIEEAKVVIAPASRRPGPVSPFAYETFPWSYRVSVLETESPARSCGHLPAPVALLSWLVLAWTRRRAVQPVPTRACPDNPTDVVSRLPGR